MCLKFPEEVESGSGFQLPGVHEERHSEAYEDGNRNDGEGPRSGMQKKKLDLFGPKLGNNFKRRNIVFNELNSIEKLNTKHKN